MLSLLVYTQTPATLSVSINDNYQPLVTFLIYVERPFFVTNLQQFFLINTPRDQTLATILQLIIQLRNSSLRQHGPHPFHAGATIYNATISSEDLQTLQIIASMHSVNGPLLLDPIVQLTQST